MSPHTVLSRHKEVIASEIDGEIVLMSLVTGRTFGLDRRGGAIWALLEPARSVEDVVADLLKTYETTQEKCLADVMAFAVKMAEAQLVLVQEPAPAA